MTEPCKHCGGSGIDYMARPGVNLFAIKNPWERLREVICQECKGSRIAPPACGCLGAVHICNTIS